MKENIYYNLIFENFEHNYFQIKIKNSIKSDDNKS